MRDNWPCQHCEFVADTKDELVQHYRTHKVVKDRREDGKIERRVI